MNTVTITPMMKGEVVTNEFATAKEAKAFFMRKCDELGYDYSVDATEAGGRGYDYLVELSIK